MNTTFDSDLKYCLEYNPQDTFDINDIEEVCAVWEGENDGDDWRWVLRLKDGRFIFLQGGCDYTGWDCQSSADHIVVNSALEGARIPLGNSNLYDRDNDEEVAKSLVKQVLDKEKAETWREKMDGVMGVDSNNTVDPNSILKKVKAKRKIVYGYDFDLDDAQIAGAGIDKDKLENIVKKLSAIANALSDMKLELTIIDDTMHIHPQHININDASGKRQDMIIASIDGPFGAGGW